MAVGRDMRACDHCQPDPADFGAQRQASGQQLYLGHPGLGVVDREVLLVIAYEPDADHLTAWFHEPESSEPECACRFTGDTADASDCPAHGEPREPAVKLAGGGFEECSF
jgi:hypothetical protein